MCYMFTLWYKLLLYQQQTVNYYKQKFLMWRLFSSPSQIHDS
jgi:hypothetical protein